MALQTYNYFASTPYNQGGDRRIGQMSDVDPHEIAAQQRLLQAKAQYDPSIQVAKIQAGASRFGSKMGTLAERLQMQRFNQVFPYLQGQMGNQGGGGGLAPGGNSGQGPRIDAAPIYNTQQIQGQVNAATAANNATAANQSARDATTLAGRGFGANSPLLQALQMGRQNQAMAANTGNEREIRWNAAGGNAQHLLGAQQAREGQFASRQDEDIRRRSQAAQQYNSLLAALVGLV
jgi:hypothetical protein